MLRKRIHDMKIVDRNYEPPSDWMEWEKPYYTSYNECVCRIVGLLQSYLMNTKPSSALGMLALLTMCLQASMIMVLAHLVMAANGVLSTINFH
ncbi:putative auxin:hydrogen symporter [Hibiscus syriacus]|uniref:Auxin:hydrogen symporter n=1 Tax=Hibiscus syriacus TaxID=106335 RepID=A0A6A2Y3U0_HIBSY|nr:putative auxin:hydrogen symporter [Hibiscus syriacus]